jgi:hypothetical protein
MPTNLMGLDVGFSKTQRTMGIADGPLLPLGTDQYIRRSVEPSLFICAPFDITVGDPALFVITASDWS